MGRLTTHVLDTANGVPANGLRVRLHWIDPNGLSEVASGITNQDGRLETPLIEGEDLVAGTYELRFEVGEYYSGKGTASETGFLGVVPVRFTIVHPEQHYHVPLLVSPFGYTTYRGS